MTTANKNTIESALRRAGINAEVFKGDGYFYFEVVPIHTWMLIGIQHLFMECVTIVICQ